LSLEINESRQEFVVLNMLELQCIQQLHRWEREVKTKRGEGERERWERKRGERRGRETGECGIEHIHH
jgi:hypothetical protein